MSLSVLIDKVRSYNPDADLELTERAYVFSGRAHEGQYRDSGDVFFKHPYEVAKILADLELDVVTIAAGLLHDVLEDTEVTHEELEAEFGQEIVQLVDGVTKLSKIPFQSSEEHQARSLRKMFLAMAEDLRVVLIKLADRLHNMRTLRHLPPDRQKKIAHETLEIYTPLAHRLGMFSLKWEMEDLALRYLDPKGYYDLVAKIARKRQEREGELEEIMTTLRAKLAEMEVEGEIQGRPKHFYSIYQKMKQQGRDIQEIYDLVAVRVIVDSIRDCYAVLGMVHTMWKPIPGRFKDYIAMPKSNLYQSLHTTVIGPRGEPLEIQIRTWEMHRIAEKGIAAHWLYKEGGEKHREFEEKVAWLRQVMEWLRELKDPDDFMETLRIDLFEDEVFVFTPKGEVKSLPAGSTPVDFAFEVHTDIGLHCTGAKVNGRLVPLDYKLSNGEFVEIMTSKNAKPTRDWLSFVKTSKARSKIRAWVKDDEREEITERGRQMLEREVKRLGLDMKDVLKPEAVAETLRRYGLGNLDDLLAAIGYGKTGVSQALSKLLGKEVLENRRAEAKGQTRPKKSNRPAQGVLVKGMDDLLVRFSKCCNPVPGDGIVGYITRGRGVSVHRTDCPNILALNGDSARKIDVEWQVGEMGAFAVEIEVEANDRVNLLSNIMAAISEGKTNIESVNARTTKNKLAVINLIVDIRDIEHMNAVMNRIKQVNGVLSVSRAHPT